MKRIVLFIIAGWLLCLPGYGQERTVSGRVVSGEDGSSAPGVSIVVKGTTIGTTTDNDGNYTITMPAGNTTLVFSFIGLKTTD